jgi:hypothetical protein
VGTVGLTKTCDKRQNQSTYLANAGVMIRKNFYFEVVACCAIKNREYKNREYKSMAIRLVSWR